MGTNIAQGLLWLAFIVGFVWPATIVAAFLATKKAPTRVKFGVRLASAFAVPAALAAIFLAASYHPWKHGEPATFLANSEIEEYGQTCEPRRIQDPPPAASANDKDVVVAVTFKPGWPGPTKNRAYWVTDFLGHCILETSKMGVCPVQRISALEYQPADTAPGVAHPTPWARLSKDQRSDYVATTEAAYEVQLSGLTPAMMKAHPRLPYYLEWGLIRVVRRSDQTVVAEREIEFLKGRTGDSSCPQDSHDISAIFAKILGTAATQ
ncbi:hypothetical protein [Piscinibacter terrae]|uniref:Uncharacterized protein n=1 Tax=Piscinibacter terrae TaxID=2496871 RepID=A0A3N7HML4_9BURK|nr:hypothetical protein [Albitalea terrae]RQP23334.1 hypothetical protein DZC73_19755 [Albitalea terrae]